MEFLNSVLAEQAYHKATETRHFDDWVEAGKKYREAFQELQQAHKATSDNLKKSDEKNNRMSKELSILRKRLKLWHQIAVQMNAIALTMFTIEEVK